MPPSADELFLKACGMAPAARSAFLARACAGDEDLRRAVDSLLGAYATRAPAVPAADELSPAARSESHEPRAAVAPPTVTLPEDEAGLPPKDDRVGARLAGRYELLELLGEGGMGSVFKAQQHEPVRRLVAVKVIKAGMDSRDVLARFEAERQALARMDHAHIAKVFDAGTTPSGSPFFVMELVEGVPITKFCDDRRLPPRARLELFIQVCLAIQHAHQKGVIHRDIKPSNVLVALDGDRAVPKVIDFGVAKAAGQPLTERTLMTGFGSLVGTPAYMSPEQATLDQQDVDTRSDVYALGVVLYELLTGTTPLGSGALQGGSLLDLLRAIREVEAPRPSTHVSVSATLSDLAAMRASEPGRLPGLLKGELDWIALKALEKDRTRRYESASAFAADVQRFLAGEPVEAVPPSAGYRLKKLIGRHRAAAIAVTATVAALLVGLVAFAWQAKVAREQRDRALSAEAETKARAAELRLVADFQAGMLEKVDPTESGKGLTDDVAARYSAALERVGLPEAERVAELRAFRERWSRVNATDAARELLDRAILRPAIATIDKQFGDQPLVDAQLRQVLANRYEKLGLYAEALPLQTRALETRRRLLGDEHPTTLESITSMGMLLVHAGKYAEAEPFVHEGLTTRRRVLGADHADTFRALDVLAILLGQQGHFDESVERAREALAGRIRTLGEAHEDTIDSRSGLATSLQHAGKFDEAQQHFEQALEKARAVLGDENPVTQHLINNLATLLQERGRLADAESRFRELLVLMRRTSGEEHPDALTTLGNLGFVLRAQGKLAEAEPLLRESLERRRRVLGDDHPKTLFSWNDLGELLTAKGQPEDAVPHLEEAFERRLRLLGPAHPLTMGSLSALTKPLVELKRGDEAEELAREHRDRVRTTAGAESEAALQMANVYGGLLLTLERFPEAERVLREAVEPTSRVLGEAHAMTINSTNGLLNALQRQKKHAAALPLLRQAADTRRRVLAKDELETLSVLAQLREALMTLEKPAEAEPVARELVEALRRARGEEHPETLDAMNKLGVALQRQDGKEIEAEAVLRATLLARRKTLGPDHADTQRSIRNLWVVLWDQSKYADAAAVTLEEIEVFRRGKGPEAPDTLFAMARVVDALHASGRFADAERHARELLASAPRVFGPGHPLVLGTTGVLGSLLEAQGRLEEAEVRYREALEAARKAKGDPQATITPLFSLGALLRRRGQLAEAEPLLREALEKGRSVLGPKNPQTLATTIELGRLLRAQEKYPQAIALLGPIVAPAREALRGPEERRVASLLTDLGAARARLATSRGDFETAEKNLLEAHAAFSRAGGPDVADGPRALADLYARWDRSEPGQGYAGKSAEWEAKVEPAASAPTVPATPSK
jgi:eukaryotic-like serine/threonine-protein kinase